MLPEQDGENRAVLIVSGIRFRIWNHEGEGMDHRMWLLPVRWAPQGAFISNGEELAVVVTVSKGSRLSRERLVSYLFHDLILMQNSLIVEIIYVIKRKRLTVAKMCAHSVEETAQHALPKQTQLCSCGAFMASVTCSPQHSPIAQPCVIPLDHSQWQGNGREGRLCEDPTEAMKIALYGENLKTWRHFCQMWWLWGKREMSTAIL